MWPFKKKEDDLEKFERELGLTTDRTGTDREGIPEASKEETYDRLGPEAPDYSKFESPKPISQPLQQFSQNTDLQLISAKLDTIKAMLDMINQRLNSLEKNAEEKTPKQKYW